MKAKDGIDLIVAPRGRVAPEELVKETAVEYHEVQEPLPVLPLLVQLLVRIDELLHLVLERLAIHLERLLGAADEVLDSAVLVLLHGPEVGLAVVVGADGDQLRLVGFWVVLFDVGGHPVDAVALPQVQLVGHAHSPELLHVQNHHAPPSLLHGCPVARCLPLAKGSLTSIGLRDVILYVGNFIEYCWEKTFL